MKITTPICNIVDLLPIKCQPIASHLAYSTTQKRHNRLVNEGSILILRGHDLNSKIISPMDQGHEESTASGKCISVYTDEEMAGSTLIGYSSPVFGTEIKRVDCRTPFEHSSNLFLGANSCLLGLSRHSMVTYDGNDKTSIYQIDLSSGGSRRQPLVCRKTFDGNSLNSIPPESLGVTHHRSSRLPIFLSRDPFTIPLTSNIHLATVFDSDSVAMIDFRDGKTGAAEWIARQQRGSNSLIDTHDGYISGVKAACRAYLWSDTGEMRCIDRGTMSNRARYLPPHATNLWSVSGQHLGPPVESRGTMPIFPPPFDDPNGSPLLSEPDADISSAHAFSAVSPNVALVGCVYFGNSTTRLYDVKRELLIAYIQSPPWRSTVPLFVAGMPHLVGINETDRRLEIVS